MGYAGGKKANPTYHSLGDHTESIQIDYDPDVISYDDLLTIFWKEHNPFSQSYSRQYAHAVFYHNERQKKAAVASLEEIAKKKGRKVLTEIIPLQDFYRAEDYHQKYGLTPYPALVKELRAIYPNVKDLVDSTAAARINGYAAGHGSSAQLEKELSDLGLSPGGEKLLLNLVKKREQRARGSWFGVR